MVIAAAVLAAMTLTAQEDSTRELWDSAFRQRRPAGSGSPIRPVTYRAVKDQLTPKLSPPRSSDDTIVGITFWRLRRPLPQDDPNTRLLILDEEAGTEIEQVPERIEAGSPLKPGERVRLSIEVPRAGHLYVIDREQFEGGKLGPANLIYPNFQTPPDDNKVASGRQIEIPDRRDRINSFKLVKSRGDHVGEVLVVLVTPEPLKNINAHSRKPAIIDDELLNKWEAQYGLQVEHLEMEGGSGQTLSPAEKASGGDSSKLLTRDDPLPQTMYRVRSKPGEPLLVKVPIRMGN
ncbi:MAG: DUF4384 domain-containing protein [Acidobacteria bacterium]|nr:DUF4384 domain-containing protein [Acidobacteriota bacterium]